MQANGCNTTTLALPSASSLPHCSKTSHFEATFHGKKTPGRSAAHLHGSHRSTGAFKASNSSSLGKLSVRSTLQKPAPFAQHTEFWPHAPERQTNQGRFTMTGSWNLRLVPASSKKSTSADLPARSALTFSSPQVESRPWQSCKLASAGLIPFLPGRKYYPYALILGWNCTCHVQHSGLESKSLMKHDV